MIYIGSRYIDAEVQFIVDPRTQTTRPTVMRGPVFTTPYPYAVYRWVEGDRIDQLGKRFAEKSGWWWQVLDQNPEVIDPLSLTPGQTIVVK